MIVRANRMEFRTISYSYNELVNQKVTPESQLRIEALHRMVDRVLRLTYYPVHMQ